MYNVRNRIFAASVLSLFALCITSCGDEADNREQAGGHISVSQAYELIRGNRGRSDFVILDIRTLPEYRSGHIENAVNIDFYGRDFKDRLDELDREKTYLIYCRTAARTGNALPLMKGMGFLHVYNMSGGIEAWRQQGLPLVE